MAVLQSSNVRDLRQKFYELLTDFSTFPASQNFFLVNIKHIPASVTEASVNSLGLRPGTGESTGLDFVKNKTFKKYFDGYMFLATGIDLTTETTTVDNRGKLINGLLPVGPFMESRNYPDNDLDIQFSETNISLIDSIFRSWIQLYSVYGNMADVPLSTDVSIYFISKQTQSSYDSDPVITKIYTYKDCIPYVIKSANVAQYNGDVELGSVAVGWRFSKYDVRIPVLGHTPDPPALSPATPEISPEALKGPGYDFTGEVPIYPADGTTRPEFDPNMNLSNLDPNAPYPSSIIGGNVGEGSGYEETERTDKIVRTTEYKDKMVKDFIGYDSLKKRADILKQKVEQRKLTERGIGTIVPPTLQEGLRDEVDDSENITTTHWTGIGVETPTVTDDPLKSFVPPNIQKGLRAGEDPKEEEDEDPGQ
jgi:hypothetical protein